MSLNTKVAMRLIFAFLAVAALASVSYLAGHYAARNLLESEIDSRLSESTAKVMQALDIIMYRGYHDIQSFSQSPVFYEGSTPEEITQRMQKWEKEYNYESLSYFDMNRIRIADTHNTGIGKEHPLEGFWHEVLEGNVSAGADIRFGPERKIPVIYFAAPVKNRDGVQIGVIVARHTTEQIDEIIESSTDMLHMKPESGIYTTLFDKDRNIIYSNDPCYQDKVLKEKIAEFPSVMEALKGNTGVIHEQHDEHDLETEISYVHEKGYGDFAGNNWSLIVAANKTEMHTSLDALAETTATLVVTIFLLVAVAGVLVARSFSKPIKELRDKMIRSVEGNPESGTLSKAGDEIGEIAEHFDRVVCELTGSKKELENYEKSMQENLREKKKLAESKMLTEQIAKETEKQRIATLNILEDMMEARAELKKSMLKLKSLDKMKDEFANIAAHELKTPLVPILAYTGLILKNKKSKISKKEREQIETCYRNAIRLKELTQDIADISKLETKAMKFDMRPVYIQDIIDTVLEDLKPAAEGKLELIRDIKERLPAIRGDRERLVQAVSKLVENAIKFTDKGSITLRARKEKNSIVVEVSDTGIGIEKKDIPKLFMKFSQVDTSPSRRARGTGLGLAICKEIIRAHNGNVGIKSAGLGKGTTFYFKLPAN